MFSDNRINALPCSSRQKTTRSCQIFNIKHWNVLAEIKCYASYPHQSVNHSQMNVNMLHKGVRENSRITLTSYPILLHKASAASQQQQQQQRLWSADSINCHDGVKRSFQPYVCKKWPIGLSMSHDMACVMFSFFWEAWFWPCVAGVTCVPCVKLCVACVKLETGLKCEYSHRYTFVVWLWCERPQRRTLWQVLPPLDTADYVWKLKQHPVGYETHLTGQLCKHWWPINPVNQARLT